MLRGVSGNLGYDAPQHKGYHALLTGGEWITAGLCEFPGQTSFTFAVANHINSEPGNPII